MSYISTHALPFAISRAALYPSLPASVQSTSISPETDLVIAAIAKSGQVALLGSESALRRIRPSAYEDSANLQAALNTVEASNENLRPVRLFDELFGESSLLTSAPSTSSTTAAIPSATGGLGFAGNSKKNIFDEIPSHKLPSLSTLWRDLITPGLKPIAGSSTSTSPSKDKNARGGAVKNDAEDSDDEDGEEAQMEEDGQQTHSIESEEEEEGGGEPDEAKEEITYVNLPEEELVKIFSKSMDAFSAFKGKSISSDRLASKAGKDKSHKKKRKSLLAGMV